MQNVVEILSALIGFDTTSRNSNLAAIDWIEAYLAACGIACERVPDPVEPKANLWATIGPKDAPGYILSGHTDVVPVDGQAWSSDPFRLAEREGRLYGRGTADMKGFLAACLARADDMRAAPLARPLHLAFSYDEEVGCLGARTLLAHLAERRPKPLGCFVGEPTGMQPVTAHKEKRSYRLDVRGRVAHSSLPMAGVNAVDAAAEIVLAVRDLARRLAREGRRDDGFDVPFSTAHTGIVAGGAALNIIPDRCTALFEIRTLPQDDPDALLAEIRAAGRAVETEMRARFPEAAVEISETAHLPGLDTPAESDIARLAKKLSGRDDHGKVAYGTEAGLFSGTLGVPTIVIGPGSIAQAHQPDEFITRDALAACDAFLGRLIDHCRA